MTWLLSIVRRRRIARDIDHALHLRRRGRADRQERARKGWQTRRAG